MRTLEQQAWRRPKYWIVLLCLALVACSHAQNKKGTPAGKTYTVGRVSITIPDGWEQRRGELVFRKGKGTKHFGFIAVSEEPMPTNNPRDGVVLLEQAVLGMEGTRLIARSKTSVAGKEAHVMEFRQEQPSRPTTRGQQISIPLDKSIVAVFWYVYESDWETGRREINGIIRTLRIR
jgi:hypothetical protein